MALVFELDHLSDDLETDDSESGVDVCVDITNLDHGLDKLFDIQRVGATECLLTPALDLNDIDCDFLKLNLELL
jgi:hypothetical protein